MNFVYLNEEEWKNDVTKVSCMKREFLLHDESNETDMWSLSQAFTETDQKYFILIKCNTSVNTSNGMYRVMLTNGKNSFTEHFSNDQRGKREQNFLDGIDFHPLGILALFIASTCLYTIVFLVIIRWIRKSFCF